MANTKLDRIERDIEKTRAARIVPPYLLAYTSTKSRLTLSPLPIRARNTRIPINLSR